MAYMVSFICLSCQAPCAVLTEDLTEGSCEECGFRHQYATCHECGELTAINPMPIDSL